MIERALDKRIKERRNCSNAATQIVLPAGNSFLERTHADLSLSEEGGPSSEKHVRLQVPPDDKTFSFAEFWVYDIQDEADQPLAIAVQTPGELPSAWLSIGGPNSGQEALCLVEDSAAQDVICKISYQRFEDKYRILLALLPTAYHNAPTRLAPTEPGKSD